MTFPSLEDHLYPPSQAVNAEDFREVYFEGGDVGKLNHPIHQLQNRLGRVVPFAFLIGFHASEIGDFWSDGSRQEPDAGA